MPYANAKPFLLGLPTSIESQLKLEEICGRAAMYQHEENAVLLNLRHFKYLEDLEKIYADAGPEAERRALAKRLFDEEYCFNADKFVILAWLFKGKTRLGRSRMGRSSQHGCPDCAPRRAGFGGRSPAALLATAQLAQACRVGRE
jgi:hypothetical protein